MTMMPILLFILCFGAALLYIGRAAGEERIPVRLLILPKFEPGGPEKGFPEKTGRRKLRANPGTRVNDNPDDFQVLTILAHNLH